jgi:ferric-dicitrate binding protein FerR (iron transport regulator)
MDPKKFNSLLDRYLKGRANETEKALIDAWYRSYYVEESEIPLNETEKEETRKALQKNIKHATGRSSRTLPFTLYRIAAGLLLFAVIGLFYYSRTKRSDAYYLVKTATGKLEKVILPDSSIAWLNAASSLRIPKAFETSSREIFLEEGEAFFEVIKNPAQPFIVHTASLDIQVLGISFNVRSYEATDEVRVSVSTGRVSVSEQDHELAVLIPDEELSYDKHTGKYVRTTGNAANAQAWRNGDIYLRQVSFTELALVLKNTYGINLTSQDTVIRNHQFTMRLRRDLPVDEVLKLIQSIHNTNYRKEGDTIILY